jgi:hypothetical protein
VRGREVVAAPVHQQPGRERAHGARAAGEPGQVEGQLAAAGVIGVQQQVRDGKLAE